MNPTTDMPEKPVGATHRLTRSVGKIPSGTPGVLREAPLVVTGDPMPARETNISGTHSRYPYLFTPDIGRANMSNVDAFKFASGGFLVQSAEVEEV